MGVATAAALAGVAAIGASAATASEGGLDVSDPSGVAEIGGTQGKRRLQKEQKFEYELAQLLRPYISEQQQLQERLQGLAGDQFAAYTSTFQPQEERLGAESYGLSWLSQEKQGEYWDKVAQQKRTDLAEMFQTNMDDLERQKGAATKTIQWKYKRSRHTGQKVEGGKVEKWATGEIELPFDATPAEIQAAKDKAQLEQWQGLHAERVADKIAKLEKQALKKKERLAKKGKLGGITPADRKPPGEVQGDQAITLTDDEKAAIQAKAEALVMKKQPRIKDWQVYEQAGPGEERYLQDQEEEIRKQYERALANVEQQTEYQKYLGGLNQSAEEAAAGRASADYWANRERNLAGLEMAQRRMGIDPATARSIAEQYQVSDAGQAADAANRARFGIRDLNVQRLGQAAQFGRGVLQGATALEGTGFDLGGQGAGQLQGMYGSSRAGDATAQNWFDLQNRATVVMPEPQNPWSTALGQIGGGLFSYGLSTYGK